MKILDQAQIEQKIKRLAIEIVEHNYQEPQLILAGVNNNGMGFAKLLLQALQEITGQEIVLTHIRINPAAPISQEIVLDMPTESLKGKAIILIDDVANTGRTIFYAARPLMETLPKKIEVAVLVDRTHKAFPIRVDYVGLSLATTLREHIEVRILGEGEQGVYLN